MILLLLPAPGKAQQYRITGRVVDAKTKEPIPFASIGLLKEGTEALTNEKGYFQLTSLTKSEQDSLVFMTLGYCRYAVLVEPGQLENLRIELNSGCLDGINITYCPVKPYASTGQPAPPTRDELITGLPGTQYAFFIENDTRKQTREMRSVSFYIGENSLPMAPFRIRVFKADGKNHSPKTTILNEPVFLTVPRAGEWYTRDLSRYNFVAPKEGYFVVLEFGESANALPQPDMDNYIPSGQMMWPSSDFKKSSIWSYSPKKGWTLFPQSSSSRRYNASVKVEVEAAE
ncbi:carboxypeptidase-like regulatory domain-containing protein [Hymenobacter terricola]|uniref:carboxypeptidase-like regulatory domain-containing protein n=1 Tax=Hymenobacter terricola TaxID=2819236 RepID=UPI001B315594|nr:carboxypeptidase-like regulatory domain-containing protein [Hymenobacter terricola]